SCRARHTRHSQLDTAKAYDYTKEVMSQNAMATDAQEGIGAFLEKRTPVWCGRSTVCATRNSSPYGTTNRRRTCASFVLFGNLFYIMCRFFYFVDATLSI